MAAEFREHIYRSSDDRLDLYARIYDAQAGDDAQTLLLMHGLTRNSSDFDGLAAHLAPHYRLIVPDQRGRGRSEYDSDAAKYAPPVYAADMFALLAGLGVEQVGLIGTSMGGLMAMFMGMTRGDMVRAIVLNDVGPVLEEEGIERIRGYVGQAKPPENWDQAAAYVKAIVGDAFPDIDDDAVWMEYAKKNFVEKKGKLIPAYDPAIAQGLQGESASAAPPDLWPIWDALASIPVLTIRGAISDLLSAETVAEMGRRHPDNFAAAQIPNRGHAPMLDEAESIAAITDFLHGVYPD